ncbi:MAG TPA: CBS domain-containing protein [Planctomycetota bacterium]|nr:CBS domain-containing protein [Planctomycetota bacterium]
MSEIQSLIADRAVIRLPAGSTVLEAVQVMSAKNVGALLVAGDDLRPLGIFTERDLMRRVVLVGADPARVKLEEVMTRDLFTADRRSRTDEVRRELQARHIRHVPVLDGGVCVAVLGLRDLLRADLESTATELQATRLYIQGEAVLKDPGEGSEPLGG